MDWWAGRTALETYGPTRVFERMMAHPLEPPETSPAPA